MTNMAGVTQAKPLFAQKTLFSPHPEIVQAMFILLATRATIYRSLGKAKAWRGWPLGNRFGESSKP